MKCTLTWSRILTCLIIFILVAELVPGVRAGENESDGKGKKKKHWYDIFRRKKDPSDTRVKVKGTGGTLAISSGDTVVTSLLLNRLTIKPPYRWFYALNNKGMVIHFLPPLHKWFHSVRPVLIDVRTKYKKSKLMNRGKKHGHIGHVGTLVAALMYESSRNQKQEFHFNLFWCNCKHYVEYLSLGKVKGSYKRAMFQPMDKKCPLYAPLTHDMYNKIFNSKEFELHDNQKGSKQVRIKLKIPEHDSWPTYIWDSKLGK